MCEREAVDPERTGALCPENHPDVEDGPDDGKPAFQYDDLRYIELRGDGSKLPAKAWGGYSHEEVGATGDLAETPCVYTAEDIQKHPADNWGVVDVQGPDHTRFALLIFDVDIHKAPDGFDPDRVGVPDDTPHIRSQNGGFHIYFILSGYERGDLQESDFQMTTDPGFDIDIRGSVVSHHVVAPSDIPGAGGPYEVVNDDTIKAVFDPQEAAEQITLDGEPLLKFDPDGGVDSYDFDVPDDPPEDMPTRYHAGLELRKAAPDDHPNTHKVNMLTAACGLAAGYDPEDVAGHFCGEWAPMDGDVDLSDKETTEYQVQHIKDGRYSAPAESTLRDYGILDDGEHCEGCPIELHGPPAKGDSGSPTGEYHDVQTCEPPATDRQPADIDAIRDDLAGDRFDTFVDADAPVIWGDDPGTGKTTTAGIAAAARDRPHAILFRDHEKAREFITDDVTPGGYFHLKGGAQKRHEECMDADHAGGHVDCPEHPGGACPHMCPVYDLDADHPTRQAYDALKEELGPVKAHILLADELHETAGHGEDGACAWLAQFEHLEGEDRVVGVHEYQTLKSVRDDRDVIIDEHPGADSVATERELSVEDLTRMANALDEIADVTGEELLGVFAAWARDIVDVVASTDETAITDLEPPAVDEHAESVRDPIGLPEEGRFTEHTLVDEALAKAKLTYHESLLSRIQSDHLEWHGAPFAFDALIAAAIEAGLDGGAGRRAIAAPSLLDACPRCGDGLEAHDGERVCGGCHWSGSEDYLTHRDGVEQRAVAWLAVDERGRASGLATRRLPVPTDLPSAPLVLNATPSVEEVAYLYDADVDDVLLQGDEPLAVDNLHATQVLDGQYHWSTIKQTESLQDRIERTLSTLADVHEDLLVLGRDAARQALSLPDNVEWLKYHAARGKNRAEYDAVVCIGAPHPDVDDLRRDARLLTQGTDGRAGGVEHSTRRDCENPPVYRKLEFADENGDGRAVPTKHYTGLAGSLFRQTREQELEQAVHRIRPLLAGDTKHAYLLTNVPTALPIDEVCSFDELSDPLRALLPVADGAIELAKHIRDVAHGDGPDGFRAETLVERDDDGRLSYRVSELHRLATAHGQDVTERTVRRWVDDLVEVGLLEAGEYQPRDGVPYRTDEATLTQALSVIHNNAGVEVAVQRRLRRLIEESADPLDWIEAARKFLGLVGDRCLYSAGLSTRPSPG